MSLEAGSSQEGKNTDVEIPKEGVNGEEKELNSQDLCGDPVCANVHNKKLVGLQEGLANLDKILTAITGLCKEPTCAFKTPATKAPPDLNLPTPNLGTCITSPFTPMEKIPEGNQEDTCGGTPCPLDSEVKTKSIEKEFGLGNTPCCGPGVCKGPTCYSAYMGYRMQSPGPKTCGDPTCGASKEKKTCGGATCPFKEDPKKKDLILDWDTGKTFGPCGGSPCPNSTPTSGKRMSLFPDLDVTTKLGGPFGGSPYTTKNDLYSSTYRPSLGDTLNTAFLENSGFDSTKPDPRGGSVCPTDLNNFNQTGQTPVGLCGRTSCQFASLDGNTKRFNTSVTSPGFGDTLRTFGSTDFTPLPKSLCGRTSCPFAKIIPTGFNPNLSSVAPCGNNTCPFGKPSYQSPVSICGRTSCPFASMNNKNTSYGQTSLCGNSTCPYSSGNQVLTGPCGGKPCPYGEPSPGVVPCPYANQTKRYPCGSPSCPHVNPSGMIYTHTYGNDSSFVQEAARPYCGSACPYDYLSSLDSNYPSPLANNYPLFDYTEPPAIPPCPYLPKKKNKISLGPCGEASCPYNTKNRKNIENDICDDSNCPFGTDNESEGICGGPKKFSCDHPDVEPCGSPDCKMTVDSSKCNSKTCPYMKTLVFCDGCGGVLPEKDSDDFNETAESDEVICVADMDNNTRLSTVKGDIQCGETGEVIKTNEDLDEGQESIGKVDESKNEKANSSIENDKLGSDDKIAVKQRRVSKKKSESLYSYPGVQIGHKDCSYTRRLIPSYMGWLWNVKPYAGDIELWRGYKPGAISRAVYKIIKAHKRALGLIDPSDSSKKKKSKTKFKYDNLKHYVELKKKDGDYTITVNPIKDPKKVEPFENPFMDVTPMQFKIEKEKKEPKDPAFCPCDEDSEQDVASSVSSELEFHFSPPGAIPRTNPRRKKDMADIDTQYNIMDVPEAFRTSDKSQGGASKGAKGGKKGKDKGKGKKGKKK